MLFSDRKNLLSLYNAVNGRSYTNPEKLEFLHRSLLYFIMEQGKQMTGKPLKLSQMYENFTGEPALELVVTMFNVNEGHNKELMEQCRILKEYAKYVTKVRKYAQNMKLEKAVNRAVDECIKEGILAEFLKAKKAEVIAVSIFEYDKEEEEKSYARRNMKQVNVRKK